MSPAKTAMTNDELRKMLADAGVSQQQLADKLGVAKQTVHRWCAGTRGIDTFKAAAIRKALK